MDLELDRDNTNAGVTNHVPLATTTIAGDAEVTLLAFEPGQSLVFVGYALVGALTGRFGAYNYLMDSGCTALSQVSSLTLHAYISPACYSLPAITALSAPAEPIAQDAAPLPSPSSPRVSIDLARTRLGSKIFHFANQLLKSSRDNLVPQTAILALVDFSWANLHAVHNVTSEFAYLFTPRDAPRVSVIPVPFIHPVQASAQARALPTVATPPAWQVALATVLADMTSLSSMARMATLPVHPVLVAVGAKGHGKSTFNRSAVNVLLSSFPRVAFLDVDPGQAEFTAPGVLALTILDHPVLGPGYMHFPQPPSPVAGAHTPDVTRTGTIEARWYGALTPSTDPGMYLALVRDLVKRYRAYADAVWHANGVLVPLVVNAMGWVKSLGLDMLRETVNETTPTSVVVLGGSVASDVVVDAAWGWAPIIEGATPFASPPASEEIRLAGPGSPRIVQVPSAGDMGVVPTGGARTKFNPSDLRMLALATTMLGRPTAAGSLVTLAGGAAATGPTSAHGAWLDPTPLVAPTYPCVHAPLTRAHLVMLHAAVPRHEILAAVNATLVALCVARDAESSLPVAARAGLPADMLAWSARVGGPTVARTIGANGSTDLAAAASHQFLGLAVIRAVGVPPSSPPSEPILYLATPVPYTVLEEVGETLAIVRGEVDLGSWLHTYGIRGKGLYAAAGPYLTTGAMADGVGAVVARVRRTVLRKSHANAATASLSSSEPSA